MDLEYYESLTEGDLRPILFEDYGENGENEEDKGFKKE